VGALVQSARQYSAWRFLVRRQVVEYARWLEAADLHGSDVHARCERLLAWTADEKLTVAVVGEFSRGKSELINALFASGGYGRRLLPSFPGRSTMCPTELKWDEGEPPSMHLLPVETRGEDETLTELKRRPEAWHVLPLNLGDPQELADVFLRLTQTRMAPREEAVRYGLLPGGDPGAPGADVEIPCWRHAVVNFPHPLLAQGLVIFDTPGLNVIGTEPELTLNLLPNAQALLFLLSIDTGVTQTDLQAWRTHLAPLGMREAGCLVVLNKVDTLWDGLRSEEEIGEHVRRLVDQVSEVLDIDPRRVLPVSAQKGLVANVLGDDVLLARSGLGALEHALVSELIPTRHEVIRAAVRREFDALAGETLEILRVRLECVRSELEQLRAAGTDRREAGLRAFVQVRHDKDELALALAHFRQVRRLFSERSNVLFTHLGLDALDAEERRTLTAMTQSYFTKGLRDAMASYFEVVETRLLTSSQIVEELRTYMQQVYAKYEQELQLRVGTPRSLSLVHWTRELRSVIGTYRGHFDTLATMVTNEQSTLTRKFFRTLAARVRKIYSLANYEATHWLRTLIAPLERQVGERQASLRVRLVTVKQMLDSSEAVEARVTELEATQRRLEREIVHAQSIATELERVLDRESERLPAAA
jgi:GTPase SAR1 family protein